MEQADKNQTEICDHCCKEIQVNKMGTHYGYCSRNYIKCSQCNQMYDRNYEDEHQQQFHHRQTCSMCGKQLMGEQIKTHQSICQFRLIQCQYCDLGVPMSDYEQHFKKCESRTTKCEICQRDIVNKNYYQHIETCNGQPQIMKNENDSKRNRVQTMHYDHTLDHQMYTPYIQKKRIKKETIIEENEGRQTKQSAKEIFQKGGKRQNKAQQAEIIELQSSQKPIQEIMDTRDKKRPRKQTLSKEKRKLDTNNSKPQRNKAKTKSIQEIPIQKISSDKQIQSHQKNQKSIPIQVIDDNDNESQENKKNAENSKLKLLDNQKN